MAALNVFLTGMETHDTTEFNRAGGQASANTTNPKAGSYCLLLNYTNTGSPAVRGCGCEKDKIPSYKNWSFKCDLRLEGTPAATVVIFNNGATGHGTGESPSGDVLVKIDTNRKIAVTTNAGTTTGSTVLATGTYYRLEARCDKTGDGKVYIRIDGVDELNTTCAANAATAFSVGETNKVVGVADAAVSFRMDDMCLLTVPAAQTDNPPWWNACGTVYGTVDAAGTNNDFTGVGDATNKYLNVDDYATNDGDSTYNKAGTIAVTKKQDHSLATPTISGTLQGFTIYGLSHEQVTVETDQGTVNILLIDNSVEYTNQQTTNSGVYVPNYIGYKTRPDGSSLAASDIGAMSAGYTVYLGTHSSAFSTLKSANSGGSSQTVARLPTGDSGTDNAWTVNSGSSAHYTYVDEEIGVTPDGSNYLKSTTVGQKQGFTFGAFTPAAGQVVSGITLRTFDAAAESGTVRGGTYRGYVLIGGVYYYTTAFTTFIGDHQYTWSVKPSDSSNWANTDVAGNEWGVEVVSIDGSKYNCIDSFNIIVDCRSVTYYTSIWVVSADGSGFTEVARAGGHLLASTGVGR